MQQKKMTLAKLIPVAWVGFSDQHSQNISEILRSFVLIWLLSFVFMAKFLIALSGSLLIRSKGSSLGDFCENLSHKSMPL